MLDALLADLEVVCGQLLPILGAVALIFLCILLRKLWKLIEAMTVTVQNLDPTLRKVDQSVEKLQAPLDTAVRLSHSVDKVQARTEEAFGKVSEFAADSISNLKDFTAQKKGQTSDSNVTKEVHDRNGESQ